MEYWTGLLALAYPEVDAYQGGLEACSQRKFLILWVL